MSVTFVVMAGGRGERLWPLVRASKPKVCLSANGGGTLLQDTLQRLRGVEPKAQWLIVTTAEQAAAVRNDLPPAMRDAVLVEPQIRNTAACITLAAVALAARDPRGIMVAVPADHWVGKPAAFQQAVRTAIRAAAASNLLATIGLRPTHPHEGFGYLCAGPPIKGFGDGRAFRLARFIEKPSAAVARRLMRRPRTYWNSGMFIGTADAFLARISQWLPDHARRLIPLATHLAPRGTARNEWGAAQRRAFARRASAAYRALRPVSFDHGVMSRLREGIVVEGRFPWADLGSWDTWARVSGTSSHTVAVQSRNVTVVSAERHLVAAVGVRDLVIVHTPSATLVCRPDRTQAVRQVVRRIVSEPALAAYR